MSEPVSDLDRRFMAAAIRLGAAGLGTTWPNPSVGALVVRDRIVVGRGRTAPGGRPHAEVRALAEAGAAARDATLYVSLEPCSHHGRTPPCADAVIAAGIARVAPLADSDFRVAGEGFGRLRSAGIAVAAGVLAAEGARVHAGHLTRVRLGRPHVTLKLAVSADDAIGRTGERQVAVTGSIARRHSHAMRSRADAILIGAGTVIADDPLLTCRLPGLEGRSPVRVVLDTEGKLPSDRRIFSDRTAPTWLFTSAGQDQATAWGRVFSIPKGSGGLALAACLERLAGEGITSVLVEGGAKTARSLVEADLVDEVALFRSPVILGGAAVPALAGLPLAAITAGERYRRTETRQFGPDRMLRFERMG